jgi:histidinol phosphatase-like PHP family hydrolase
MIDPHGQVEAFQRFVALERELCSSFDRSSNPTNSSWASWRGAAGEPPYTRTVPIYDFHLHSALSGDAELGAVELAWRALSAGYTAFAITDHCALGTLPRVVRELRGDIETARREWGATILAGVELTHLPPALVERAARVARAEGAELVICHGETINEPVEPGINVAAIQCGLIDVLAHPGLLTLEQAREAASRGVFLELSSSRGHGLANGRVAKVAKQAGARLLLNSDNHLFDFLTPDRQRKVLLGAGLEEGDMDEILVKNPLALLERAGVGSAVPRA